MYKQEKISKEEIKSILKSSRFKLPSNNNSDSIKQIILDEHKKSSFVNSSSHEEKIFSKKLKFNKLIIKPMIPILIAVLILVGGTGTAIAADNSVPGDALFGVDQALEKASLSFDFSDDAKAKKYLEIAEEREHEYLELIKEDRITDAEEAGQYLQNALAEAEQAVAKVELILQEQNNIEGSDSLAEAAQKLNELKVRFSEKTQELILTEIKDEYGKIELETDIEDGQSYIKLEIGEVKYKYDLDSTNTNDIVQSIQERTGLTIEQIELLLDESGNKEDSSEDVHVEEIKDEVNDDINDNDENTKEEENDNKDNINDNDENNIDLDEEEDNDDVDEVDKDEDSSNYDDNDDDNSDYSDSNDSNDDDDDDDDDY